MKTLPAYLTFSFSLLWCWSGIQPLLSARQASLQLLADIGFAGNWQLPVLLAASAWDVLLGLLLLSPARKQRWLWAVQAATVAAYTVIVALLLPENWLHPFAPLVKNFPLLAVMLWLAASTGQDGRSKSLG